MTDIKTTLNFQEARITIRRNISRKKEEIDELYYEIKQLTAKINGAYEALDAAYIELDNLNRMEEKASYG